MKTTQAALGKWPSILTMMGVNQDYLTGKHTSCPNCGGSDRFRFADTSGKGEHFCSQCGHGDGFDLVQKLLNCDFKQAALEVEKVAGIAERVDIKPQQTTEEKRQRLNALNKRVKPIAQSKSVCDYLSSRGIDRDIFTNANLGMVKGYENFDGGHIRGRFDSMVGKVLQCGRPITYHITFTDQGRKADVRTVRKVLPPVVKFTHGAIELFKPREGVLGVAEGIETALSAYQLFGVPTWSCLNLNSLQNFVVPNGVDRLYIFADNDTNGVGLKAANHLKQKAEYQGLEVIVQTPSTPGNDWNDVLIQDKG